jgi:hypothetical protein
MAKTSKACLKVASKACNPRGSKPSRRRFKIYKKKELTGSTLAKYKATLSLTEEQKDVIIGTLLGDSTMGLRDQQRLYSLKFEQKGKNVNYMNHLYEIMEPYVGTPPQYRKGLSYQGEIQSSWFRTYRHDHFIFYSNLFYRVGEINGKKVGIKIVPQNIHKVLNARVLAYWFMDDGTLSGDQYYLSTQSFQKHEVTRLSVALKECFGIKSSVHKDNKYWRLYIRSESNRVFEDLVTPYLHETFFYKIRAAYRPKKI